MPFKGAPRLPARRANGRPWSQLDRQTWKAWSTMPHAKLWGPSEWAFALVTIELAAMFHDTSEPKYATELRNRERILGTTADYRRDLRIRYVDPQTAAEKAKSEAAGVTNLADYRDF